MAPKQIDRPDIDITHFKRILQDSIELFELGMQHIHKHSRNLHMLYLDASHVVLCGLATSSKLPLVKRCIPITGQLASALFKLGNPNYKEKTYQLEDRSNVIGADPISESHLHEGNWLAAYWWNRIASQERQIDWLLDFSTKIMTQSSTKGPKFHASLVDSIKAFENNSKSFRKLIKSAIEIGESESREKWVKFAGLPIARLMSAIYETQEDVSDLVCIALEGHKRCTQTIDFYNGANGLIAVHVCALAKIARERGLKVNVKSDYLPNILSKPK